MAPHINRSGRPARVAGYKRWALPGMVAAAATAAIAFVVTPQLMVAMKGNPASEPAGSVVTASAAQGTVLRDERIDDYLLAHQRFSPSVFSTAQYARTATFSTDSNK
jgi:sigma-E factor negative regulatory protein RseA